MMIRILILTLVLFMGASADVKGQPSGWMITGYTGMVYRFPNSFASEVNAMLRDRSNFPQIASNMGLGVTYRFNEKYSVGVDVWGVFYPTVETLLDLSHVTLRGLSGELKGYYHVFSKEKWDAASFFGLGYYHTESNISNDGFLVNSPPLFIPPGADQTIYGQLVYMDLGAQLFRITSSRFWYGLVGGLQFKVLSGDWESSWGASISTLSEPALSILYLRLSIALKN
jgi:hypothetical protein